MSDIHGEYDRYETMLKKIKLADSDKLYILGDVVDRGRYGVKILCDIRSRANVVLLRGNHEQMLIDAYVGTVQDRDIWLRNGGTETYDDMQNLPPETRKDLLAWLIKSPDFLQVQAGGKQYYLVHGQPANNADDRIWGRVSTQETYDKILGDSTVVFGHTPTWNYRNHQYKKSGETIWCSENKIGIDCGCGHLMPCVRLACLRLDDEKVFYV